MEEIRPPEEKLSEVELEALINEYRENVGEPPEGLSPTQMQEEIRFANLRDSTISEITYGNVEGFWQDNLEHDMYGKKLYHVDAHIGSQDFSVNIRSTLDDTEISALIEFGEAARNGAVAPWFYLSDQDILQVSTFDGETGVIIYNAVSLKNDALRVFTSWTDHFRVYFPQKLRAL